MASDLDDILARAARWRSDGLGVALATVVQTWGSSPRPAGSKLVVNERSEHAGSVSGGCIEGAVISEALAVMRGAPPKLLQFGVTDEAAWEVGLACGGRVEVHVAAMNPAIVEELRAARAANRAVALVTSLTDGSQRVITRETADALAPIVARALDRDVAEREGDMLVEPVNPPLRLVIVGAVHVAQPLAQMARLAGFAVTIVDPRRAFATAERFPGETLVTDWPDVAVRELALDRRSALVTLTHDPKLDDPALIAALASPAFYVGCLGSKKTHASRRERLAGAGVAAADLDRMRGPVGLPIGARSPAEIAVSTLGEIIATLRGA